MIIYKVKLRIRKEKEKEWFKWMSKKHIPDVINTGHFTDYTFIKLMTNGAISDADLSTYEIQYFCNSWNAYNDYISKDAEALREEHQSKYGDIVTGVDRGVYEDLTEKEPEEMVFP